MLLELFPFVILNNAMAFVYMHIFSLTLCFDMSLLLLTVTLRGVSNKHCLLSLFFIGMGKGCIGFEPNRIRTLVSMATDSSHRVIMGEML